MQFNAGIAAVATQDVECDQVFVARDSINGIEDHRIGAPAIDELVKLATAWPLTNRHGAADVVLNLGNDLKAGVLSIGAHSRKLTGDAAAMLGLPIR